MSMVIEDIVPMGSDDPNVVTAAITSVVEQDLPFTQLGEGDTRVRAVGHQAKQLAQLVVGCCGQRHAEWLLSCASSLSQSQQLTVQ
jgi:hypothetical protein